MNYELLGFALNMFLPGIQRGVHKSVSCEEEAREYEADDVDDHDEEDDEEEIEELWGLLEGEICLTVEAGGREAVVPGDVGQSEAAGAEDVKQCDGDGDHCRHS